MAEAMDRSGGGPGEAAPPAEGVTVGRNVNVLPAPEFPPARLEQREAYQPVSVLAIAGLVLGVLYAVLVCLGGVVAFAGHYPRGLLVLTLLAPLLGAFAAWTFGVRRPRRLLALAGLSLAGLYAAAGLIGLVGFSSSQPWLLPGWTLLLPIAAAGLSWVARGQIRGSEGTLAGAGLTSWGLGLSLFFGLNYALYLTATFLAVRQQASDFTQQWLTEMCQGHLDRAFLLTIRPPRPAANAALRDEIELRYNDPAGMTTPGPFTRFCEADYVRLLQQAGDEARVRPLGSSEWDHEQGGYRVQLQYAVSTPLASFELQVQAVGSESPTREFKGRQWHIAVNGNTGVNRSTLQFTPLGEEVIELATSSSRFAEDWVKEIMSRNLDQAYLDTLPPGDRKGQGQDRQGRDAFLRGSLVHADPRVFWVSAEMRPEIIKEVKGLFRRETHQLPQITPEQVTIPVWSREGDRLRIHHDMRLLFLDPRRHAPRFLVQAQLVVEIEESHRTNPGGWWRVVRLDLIRARSSPAH